MKMMMTRTRMWLGRITPIKMEAVQGKEKARTLHAKTS